MDARPIDVWICIPFSDDFTCCLLSFCAWLSCGGQGETAEGVLGCSGTAVFIYTSKSTLTSAMVSRDEPIHFSYFGPGQ